MNINAIEMMSLNNRTKFGMQAKDTPTTEPQVPVTKPQFGMEALEAQANNNIAFQGLNMAKYRKPIMGLLIPLAMAGAAGTMTSCDRKFMEPTPTVVNGQTYIDVTVNVDMSSLTTMMAEWMAYMQEQMALLREQNATMTALYNAFMQFYNDYKAGRTSDEEFQKNVVDYFKQLVAQGDTIIGITSEQNDGIKAILAQLEAGQITYEQAFQQIITLLGSINDGLTNILSELQSFHNDYLQNEEQSQKYLKALYNQGKVVVSNLEGLNQTTTNMSNSLNNLETKADSLIAIVSRLEGNQITPAELQAMFSALGITIQDAANMSKDEIIAAINKFKNTYVKTEAAQTALLQELVDKQFTLQELKDILDDYSLAGGGMSLAEFKAYMNERDARRDEDNWAKFEQYMQEKGFTTLPDLLAHIDNDLHNMPDYAALIDRVITALNNIDENTTETNAILRDIYDLIDAFRNDCKECCENIIQHLEQLIGTHEGVLD